MNNRNGLVDVGNLSFSDYDTVLEDNKTPTNYGNDALKGNIGVNPVSKLYFSELNLKSLQIGIKNRVLNETCGKYHVGDQSNTELLIVMRGIYLQDVKSSNIEVVIQVRLLNGQVLDYVVPRIIDELHMRDRYIKDISTMNVPMAYGENTNVAGTKQLEFKRFL